MASAKPNTARPLSLFLDGTPTTPNEVRAQKLWLEKVGALLKLAHDEYDNAWTAATMLRYFCWRAQESQKARGRKANEALRRITGLADLLIARMESDVGASALREVGVSIQVEAQLLTSLKDLRHRTRSGLPQKSGAPPRREFLIHCWVMWKKYSEIPIEPSTATPRAFLDFVALVMKGPGNRPLRLGTREDIATEVRKLRKTGLVR